MPESDARSVGHTDNDNLFLEYGAGCRKAIDARSVVTVCYFMCLSMHGGQQKMYEIRTPPLHSLIVSCHELQARARTPAQSHGAFSL